VSSARVRERRQKAALYEGLGSLGQKLYMLPPKSKAVQLTIIDTCGELDESYVAIVNAAMLAGLKPGVLVWVQMTGEVSPSQATWVIIDINAI
jgi:hypothetical protein